MAAIINSGKQYITDNIAGNVPSQITRFILATVPHSDPTIPVNLDETMPSAGQIVYDEPITRTAKINPDEVVYSQLLLSDVGDFEFNWIGLATADHTLIAVVYVPTQHKRKYEHRQVGNSITRNVVLKFANAADALDVTIAPETWQFDITDFVRDEIQKGLDGHDHDDDYYPKAKTNELLDEKIDKSAITDNISSTSSVLVASAKALKTVKDIAAAKWTYVTATTGRYGATLLSNLYNGSSQTKAVTELALKNGLATKTNTNHAHDDDYYLKSQTDSLLAGKLSNSAKATLTDNDGHGNANVTFNHKSGVPQQNGSSVRIETAVDNNVASMIIELGDSVIEGVAKTLIGVITLTTSSIALMKNTTVSGWLNASFLKEAGVSLVDKYALKTKYYYTADNVTLTRHAQHTIVHRWHHKSATISIDASTFQVGDIITIVNVREDSGTVTITNLDGTINVFNGSSAGTHTFTGMGQVSFIRYGSGNNFMQMTE